MKKSILKKTIIASFLAIFFSIASYGQTTWTGNTTQEAGGVAYDYPTILEITENNGEVKGTLFFMVPGTPALFLYTEVTGTVKKGTYTLKENKIIKAAQLDGDWLLKNIVLELKKGSDGVAHLIGSWKAMSYDLGGTINLVETPMLKP